MAEIEVIRDAEQMTVRAGNGCTIVKFPEPHIALISYEGVAYGSFVGPVVAEIEQRGRFPIVLAVDASALSSYETEFRKLWTDWMAAKDPRAVLILSRSRLVAMGIALANAVLGGKIRGFSSQDDFERAVAAERSLGSSVSTTA